MRRHAWVIVVLAGLLGLGGGAALRYWQSEPASADAGQPASGSGNAAQASAGETGRQVIGARRPGFALPDIAGEEVSIDSYAGDVVLINFWATWCPPCVEEMPALADLQARLGERGLQVVGVAIDARDAVQRFAAEHGIDYPLLVGERDAFEIAREYGNARGTLPYTVVVDRAGTIRETHLGPLDREEAAALVRPYL